jgi:DNA-binding GntR family transcriptional regulator
MRMAGHALWKEEEPLAGRSLTTLVCARIRAEILSGRLLPGEKLKINALMLRYGAGLSAVREALSRLVAEGFVRAVDQRGFSVSRLSLDDLQDITRARIHIETHALRLSIERGGLTWEARITSEFEHTVTTPKSEIIDGNIVHSDAWSEHHSRFHHVLLAECGSLWLLQFRQTLFEQWERYRRFSISGPPETRDVDAEHEALMHAALGRDVERATRLLTAHIETTARVLLRSQWPTDWAVR